MIAHGRLQHHFWGTYHASIVLVFADEQQAIQAREHAFQMFQPHPHRVSALYFQGSGTELKAAEAALKAHGANMNKVRSLARSIDFGEPFTVEVIPHDGSIQQVLFAEDRTEG